MGLNERLRPTVGPEIKLFPPKNSISFRAERNEAPKKEGGGGSRIREVLGLIRREDNRKKEGDRPQRKNTFEPFTNPDNNPGNLFVNGYNGNYAQSMELDRKGIEAVLKIAHLNGKVSLSSMPKSRDRSLDGVNDDGSIAAKKTPMFDDKAQRLEDKKNPLYRTVPVAEGWRIEINDEMMMEKLQKKGLTGKKLQGKFVQEFNGIFTTAVFECITREKLSNVKDPYIRRKLTHLILNTSLQLTIGGAISVGASLDPLRISMQAGPAWLLANLLTNISDFFRKRDLENQETVIRMINPKVNRNSFYPGRQIDHHWEYFMPLVEIDKVARTLVLLSLPGKKLVREKK